MLGAVGAGVIMLTKTVAKELGRFKIRVNTVALSLTSDTPTWERLSAGQGFERDLFTKLVNRFPFGMPPVTHCHPANAPGRGAGRPPWPGGAITWIDLRPVEEGEQGEKGQDENAHPEVPPPA
jgi:NAD(P)-dependent dehydrogenase (short-subunit alcohol dehydrogenase family)